MMDVNQACEAFKVLLEQQLDRVAKMNTNKKDFSTQKVITIGVVDGDGIGPIITAQASRVLEKVLADEIAAGSIVIKQIEGLTIENRMACGKAIPDDVLAEIKSCDVLLKGPTRSIVVNCIPGNKGVSTYKIRCIFFPRATTNIFYPQTRFFICKIILNCNSDCVRESKTARINISIITIYPFFITYWKIDMK